MQSHANPSFEVALHFLFPPDWLRLRRLVFFRRSSNVREQPGVKSSCYFEIFRSLDSGLSRVGMRAWGSKRRVNAVVFILFILWFRAKKKNLPWLCSSTGNWFCNIKNSVAEFHYFSESIPFFLCGVGKKYHSLLNYFSEKSLGLPS